MKKRALSTILSMSVLLGCSDPFAKRTCELNEAAPARDMCFLFFASINRFSGQMTDAELKKAMDGLLLICAQAIVSQNKCDEE
ncbi:hypothetical protein [Leptonema illini]|uniref:Lipoprotein n=1 Tax=Leptonema illini DSM 21528 TaxID=929563 RepID=H2CH71_9LEPT|nr:hypothetical protein [Leptonema illini]EHQ06941.1 hypothetical protein Lepil_2265 [Leptonema illini DSM 21528]